DHRGEGLLVSAEDEIWGERTPELELDRAVVDAQLEHESLAAKLVGLAYAASRLGAERSHHRPSQPRDSEPVALPWRSEEVCPPVAQRLNHRDQALAELGQLIDGRGCWGRKRSAL